LSLISLFVSLALSIPPCYSEEILVGPYLGEATPASQWISWETDSNDATDVSWGATRDLGHVTNGEAFVSRGKTKVHEARLSGLAPDTKYFYRVTTSDARSEIFSFRTPPLLEVKKPFRFFSFSDNHHERPEIGIFGSVIKSMEDAAKREGAVDIEDDVALAINAGDMVGDEQKNGYGAYRTEYFKHAESLAARIPVYSVIGNHEQNSKSYFDYFHLPENANSGLTWKRIIGSKEYMKHWYSFQYSNVHFIGLDTNSGYRNDDQLKWLEEDLKKQCSDPNTDFFVIYHHHPFESVLWPEGNTPWVGKVIGLMERYSDRCGKPAAQFSGHTHGYSKGQSPSANLYLIDTAASSGWLDTWGRYSGNNEQKNYKSFTKSIPEFGFLVMDVTTGPDAMIRFKRYTLGTEETLKHNREAGLPEYDLQDTFVLKKNNKPPLRPILGLLSGNCDFQASAFNDPDGDAILGTQWQVAQVPTDFEKPLIDDLLYVEDWFNGDKTRPGFNPTDQVDLMKGIDITKWKIAMPLKAISRYYARARYRDSALAWSQWSDAYAFTTGETGRECVVVQ